MSLNRRSNARSVWVAFLATAAFLGVLAAPLATSAQVVNPFPGPSCYVPPAPSLDTWPVAAPDSLGTTVAVAPIGFSGATLLSNDTGASIAFVSVSTASYGGGTITGTGPYTYTAAPLFVGTDVFSYEISDASGWTTTGVVTVAVVADAVAPTVSLSSPAVNAAVSGIVTVSAVAADNVGVAGVSFFDGASQIGAEDLAPSWQVSWDTRLVADGPHSLSAVARDASGHTATSAPVAVNVSNVVNATVPTVVGLTQAAATAAITGAHLTVGAITTANSATVLAGSVISQSPLGGTSVAPSSAVALVVSLGPSVATAPVIAQSVGVNKENNGVAFIQTAVTAITPGANTLIVVLVGADAPNLPAPNTTITSVTNTGVALTWNLAARSNTQRGTSEVWWAFSTPAHAAMRIRANLSTSQAAMLSVQTFSGAASSLAGAASAIASGATGSPTASLVTTRANSWVFAIGNDFDHARTMIMPLGRASVRQFRPLVDDTYWAQRTTDPVATAGTSVPMSVSYAGPNTDQWNLALIEIPTP